MSGCAFGPAQPGDREDIIDFINSIFSQAVRPHDFSRLYPSVYGPDTPDFTPWHYIARENGRIRGVVGMRPTEIHVLDSTLRVGYIGSVSVHPACRKHGYMAQLMNMAIDAAQKNGYDMLVLGGQRQRYGYYGFMPGGQTWNFTVTSGNVRHALRETDSTGYSFEPFREEDTERIGFFQSLQERAPFHVKRPMFARSVQTSGKPMCSILRNGRLLGYAGGDLAEIGLDAPERYPEAIKAYMEASGLRSLSLECAPWETERIRFLLSMADHAELYPCMMIRVLSWERVLSALLPLKNRLNPLPDTDVMVRIDGSPTLHLSVQSGNTTVHAIPSGDGLTLSAQSAMDIFFSPFAPQILPASHPLASLCSLPFHLGYADSF